MEADTCARRDKEPMPASSRPISRCDYKCSADEIVSRDEASIIGWKVSFAVKPSPPLPPPSRNPEPASRRSHCHSSASSGEISDSLQGESGPVAHCVALFIAKSDRRDHAETFRLMASV